MSECLEDSIRSLTTAIQYLEKNNLQDKVLSSIISQYRAGKELSEKQQVVITRNYTNHKTAKNFFNKKEDNLNDFQKSLKEQFDSKGFLTDKQMKFIR